MLRAHIDIPADIKKMSKSKLQIDLKRYRDDFLSGWIFKKVRDEIDDLKHQLKIMKARELWLSWTDCGRMFNDVDEEEIIRQMNESPDKDLLLLVNDAMKLEYPK